MSFTQMEIEKKKKKTFGNELRQSRQSYSLNGDPLLISRGDGSLELILNLIHF